MQTSNLIIYIRKSKNVSDGTQSEQEKWGSKKNMTKGCLQLSGAQIEFWFEMF